MPEPIILTQFQKYRQGRWETTDAALTVESSVSLSVNGLYWLTFQCTPTDVTPLAAGFLFNEGVIASREDIAILDLRAQGEVVDVWLTHPAERPDDWRRTSGCAGGVTSVQTSPPPASFSSDFGLNPSQVGELMGQLIEAQSLYHQTRGIHCSALSDGVELRFLAEDIGRHNTLDKLAGKMLFEPPPSALPVILTTGRISSEMLQKSARLGAAVVISRTAVNDTSIHMAHQSGLTLIGYARGSGFNLYTHPQRIRGAVAAPAYCDHL